MTRVLHFIHLYSKLRESTMNSFLLIFFVLFFLPSSSSKAAADDHHHPRDHQHNPNREFMKIQPNDIEGDEYRPSKSISSSSSSSCDLFQGSWVYDEDSYPLYDSLQCPFISSGLNCLKNGRIDKWYLQYRWKPTGCDDIPRFDSKEFLERFRGKKVMFVGDSLSSNQWQSLGCMLHASVPNANYTLLSRGQLTTISFLDYGVSVMFLKNGFLISLVNRTLRLDALSGTGQWKGIDVMIFNSYHWWLHTGHLRTWDRYQIGDKTITDMDVMEAYKTALTTWADWIDLNVDPAKTRVFFQGISTVHYHGIEWNEPDVQNCSGQTKPVEGSSYPGDKPPGDAVVRSVISNMKKPAILLDIVLLTQLRKDGHPSVYAGGGELDCSHWCVAGVPDAWNELLYTILMQN